MLLLTMDGKLLRVALDLIFAACGDTSIDLHPFTPAELNDALLELTAFELRPWS